MLPALRLRRPKRRARSQVLSVGCAMFCSIWRIPSSYSQVGAKMGANVHSHRAIPSDVQPGFPQVNGTPGDMRLHRAIGWS